MTSSQYYNPTISELRNTWEAAASGWAKWEPTISAGLVNATEAMIDMAGIRPGMRVLDVGCGAGFLSLEAAERVGPTGSVVANDISPTMLLLLRVNAARAGLRNIETLECAAEDLDEADGPFDAVICRLGLALFVSQSKALEAIQRVLKPGGRFAALIFTSPENNIAMAQPMAILLRHSDRSGSTPRKTSRLFTLGSNGKLESLMKGSGLTDVQTQTAQARVELRRAMDAMRMMQEAFGTYRATVADLSPEEQYRAWIDVHECLSRFEIDGYIEMDLEFMIGAGAKPI